MRDPARQPVVLGSGQLRANRDRRTEDAREPLLLLLDAAGRAAADTGVDDPAALLSRIDDVSAVRTVSWTYDDLAALVATRLGAHPRRCEDAPLGGQWPVRLLDAAAARIASGESDVALVVGGEAQASVSAFVKAGVDPVADLGWSSAPGGPPPFDPDELGTERMRNAGLVLPIRLYPLFENRLQADLGLTAEENGRWSAELYAAFSRVAAGHPAAWSTTPRAADDIGTAGPDNRMIAEPYPRAMTAMPHVDQAAAVLLTSRAVARELGVPDERMVLVRSSSACDDTTDLLDRESYGRSAALAAVLDRTLDRAGLGAADLDLLDVYSCFPVVPKLAIQHLGLPRDAVPTLTGGHSSFGGPLNSYSLHALATTAAHLRDDPAVNVGLVHANGGYLTAQHAVLLTSGHGGDYEGRPSPQPLPAADPPPAVAAPTLLADLGSGTDVVELQVETLTVEHGRDGQPAQAFVIGRTADGVRTGASSRLGDIATAAALSVAALTADRRTHVGRTVLLTTLDGQPTVSLP